MTKRLLSVLLAFGLLGMAVVAIPALAKTKSVAVDDDYFVSKKKHTVPSRRARRSTGAGRAPTSTTSRSRAARGSAGRAAARCAARSATKRKGNYALTFKKTGTYKIVCTVHAPDMKMTLKVTS